MYKNRKIYLSALLILLSGCNDDIGGSVQANSSMDDNVSVVAYTKQHDNHAYFYYDQSEIPNGIKFIERGARVTKGQPYGGTSSYDFENRKMVVTVKAGRKSYCDSKHGCLGGDYLNSMGYGHYMSTKGENDNDIRYHSNFYVWGDLYIDNQKVNGDFYLNQFSSDSRNGWSLGDTAADNEGLKYAIKVTTNQGDYCILHDKHNDHIEEFTVRKGSCVKSLPVFYNRENCFYNSTNKAIVLGVSSGSNADKPTETYTIDPFDSRCFLLSAKKIFIGSDYEDNSYELKYNDLTPHIATATSQDYKIKYQEGDTYNLYTIGYKDLLVYNTNNWMSKLNDNLFLDQIVMPGSHDAGMSICEHSEFYVNCNQVLTQYLDIKGQLEAGSRYFDIRPSIDKSDLVTYHRSDIKIDDVGANGQLIDYTSNLEHRSLPLLIQVSDFLKQNPSEFVILRISHTRDDNEWVKTRLIDALQAHLGTRLLTVSPDTNIAKLPISQLRGKVIAVFAEYKADNDSGKPQSGEYGSYINPQIGINAYHGLFWTDGSHQHDIKNYGLSVYDYYSGSSHIYNMWDDQLYKVKTYGGLGQDYLFELSWTLTTSGNIGLLATDAHAKLGDFLTMLNQNYHVKPNIVYLDLINPDITQSIIAQNFN